MLASAALLLLRLASRPLDAHVELLSVWTSAVLRICWDLMGSEDVSAPTHIWSCSEPNMVVESAVCIVMNWVGRSSVHLTD